MPARARQEAVESEEDAAVLDGVVIGAQTRVAWLREPSSGRRTEPQTWTSP